LWGRKGLLRLHAMGMAFLTLHRKRHLSAWLISCVLGLAALMPTLSAWVMSSQAPEVWAEVCSVQGTRWVPTGDASTRSEPASAHGQGHCPFCVLQDHSPLIPAQPVWLPRVMTAASDLLPPLFLHAPRVLHAWSPLAARAPPASV
jgi:Protein of unknown function (DUF2946)